MASRRILIVDELGKNVAFALQDSLEKLPNSADHKLLLLDQCWDIWRNPQSSGLNADCGPL